MILKCKIQLFLLKIVPFVIIATMVCGFIFVTYLIFRVSDDIGNEIDKQGGLGIGIGRFFGNIKKGFNE